MSAWRWVLLAAVPLAVLVWATRTPASPDAITVASKKFTESVILGEMIQQLIEGADEPAVHRAELGGTRVLWSALINGEIDVYPEYTGTISQEILAGRGLRTDDEIRAAVAEFGVRMSEPLGFNNGYALGMMPQRAKELGIATISDLRAHPELKFGFNNEFLNRGDGWPSVRDHYGLPQRDVRGLDHDLAYRALDNGDVDVVDLYTTDAEIEYYEIFVLEDDLLHFPRYDAVLLYRRELEQRSPSAVAALGRLVGALDERGMVAANARAKLEKTPEAAVARDVLKEMLGVSGEVRVRSMSDKLIQRTREHLRLVIWSMLAAVLVAVPLGIWASKQPRIGQGILSVVGIIQTIPSLALLVLLMKPLSMLGSGVPWLNEHWGVSGIGEAPAMVALFLYSLLPIVRNTTTGLHNIPPHIRESAMALGLPAAARLRRVELPMAARTILAGVKTSAVINVGFATLGALIGAGGYGQPILTGIRLDDYGLILMGAVPAAVLALVVQGFFEIAERVVVPKGLRLRRSK